MIWFRVFLGSLFKIDFFIFLSFDIRLLNLRLCDFHKFFMGLSWFHILDHELTQVDSGFVFMFFYWFFPIFTFHYFIYFLLYKVILTLQLGNKFGMITRVNFFFCLILKLIFLNLSFTVWFVGNWVLSSCFFFLIWDYLILIQFLFWCQIRS